MTDPNYLSAYDRMAIKSAHRVIASYSTSFSLATWLLAPQVRVDIRNLYAMVRIADEIVDGTARAAGFGREEELLLIDAYEKAVLAAPQERFHVDPVLHAYAYSARRCAFNPEHVQAFFASMRRDLHQSDYDGAEFTDYVYGSAEVIGLLCLAAFLRENPPSPSVRAELEAGARSLGAAFQKVNFLRDLGEDYHGLGRRYFPGMQAGEVSEEHKEYLLADIRADLEHARSVIALLPRGARAGVLAATELFSRLAERIAATPAAELGTRRISVPRWEKALICGQALVRGIWPSLNLRVRLSKNTRLSN